MLGEDLEVILNDNDQKITVKSIGDKTLQLDQSIEKLVIEASGIDPKQFNSDWLKPGLNLDPRLPELKIRRIIDASGDGSLNEVFEDGALRINFNSDNWPVHLNPIRVGDRVQSIHVDNSVRASVIARDLETGETIDLDSQSVNPNQGFFLVNLKDKLNAWSNRSGLRDHYDIQVEFSGGHDNQVLESFSESITLIQPLDWGSNQLGDETGNDFSYRNIGSAFGSGRIYQGRGGTDFLNLEAIRSTYVLTINGRSGIDAASAADLGQQAFYGGTVFDCLTLRNGDELYLQGIERLRFEDITIDLTPNLDAISDRQWNTQVMDVNGAWRFNTGSDDVVLVSLDNDIDHLQYLTAKNNHSQISHGHRAMSVMASQHNGEDVAGVAPNAALWGYNIYDAGVTLFDAIKAVGERRQAGQRIVFQGGIQGEDKWTNGCSTREKMESLLGQSGEWGFFSIAAGNGGPGGGSSSDPNYLTSVSGVAQAESVLDHIASVGALTFTGQEDIDGLINATGTDIASYSNRGSNLTLVAPTDSWSVDGNGAVGSFGATSCANPNLAGVAALIWSENGAISGGELREILIGSAMDLGSGGFDNTFGNGLVNAEGAIRRAHALAQHEELALFWTNQDFLA